MKRTLLIFGMLAVMAFAASANAQFARGLGTLSGSVLDARGNPVVNASVMIQTSDGLRPHAARTDANGHFEFTRFDAGQYDVRASSHNAYSEWAKHLLIRPNKTTEVTLHIAAQSK